MSSGFPRLELAVASTLGLSFLGFFASRLPLLFSFDMDLVLCRVSPRGGMPAGPCSRAIRVARDAPGAMIVGEGAGGPFGPRGAVLEMGMAEGRGKGQTPA